MGMSLRTAEFLNSWANWLLIGSLVVGVISTYAIVISSNVKEAALKGTIAQAGAEAALANERAAELKNENLRLQAQLGRWRLSEKQANAFRSLKGKIAALNLVLESNRDSMDMANQILVLLLDIGIKPGWYEGPANSTGTLVSVYDKYAFENAHGKPTGGEPLVGALKAADLFSGSVQARLPIGLSSDPDIPTLFIGERPALDMGHSVSVAP